MSDYFRKNRGFTLIELAVSIVIMTIILTIIVVKQSNYTERAALTNLADEIGSTVSQAQVYGIGVKEFSTGSSEFNAAYGLTFNIIDSSFNTTYLYFADRNANKLYDYSGSWVTCPIGGTSECLVKTSMSRGNYINSPMCTVIAGSADICNVGRIDISFARPSTEAQLLFFDMGGAPLNPVGLIGGKIVLKSPGGATSSVTVYKTGQVSVQ